MNRLLFVALISFSFSCSHTGVADVKDKTIKIAVVNYAIEGGKSVPELLAKIDKLAGETKTLGARYLLLPELITFDLMPVNPEKQVFQALAGVALESTKYLDGLKQIARRSGVVIVGGSTLVKKGERFINRAYVVNPDGVTGQQDKNYPTPWEVKHNIDHSPGIKIWKDKEMTFVILICHDAEFPSVSSELKELKPEVIFVPSQTDDMYGLERVARTSAARAVEHMSYVLMTGAVGLKGAPWHAYLGQNFLYTPQNKYFKDIPEGRGKSTDLQELSVFEVNLSRLRESRADATQIYPARDERK